MKSEIDRAISTMEYVSLRVSDKRDEFALISAIAVLNQVKECFDIMPERE
jgi:hypothetical protein